MFQTQISSSPCHQGFEEDVAYHPGSSHLQFGFDRENPVYVEHLEKRFSAATAFNVDWDMGYNVQYDGLDTPEIAGKWVIQLTGFADIS